MSTLKKKYWLLILFIFFWQENSGIAQNDYAFRTFTTKDGLPHNHIYSIAQDSTGFIWIATWDGLSRYDGYEFKNYYHRPDDSTSIPYFSVRNVVVNRLNKIWVQTPAFNYISTYQRASENFISQSLSVNNHGNYYVAIDNRDVLWIVSNFAGLMKIDNKEKTFVKIGLIDNVGEDIKLENSGTPILKIDNHGSLWIIVQDPKEIKIFSESLRKEDTIKIRVFSLSVPKINFQDSPDIFTSFNPNPYVSSSGKVYLFSNWGLFQLNENNGVFNILKEPFPLSDLRGDTTFLWSPKSTVCYLYNPNSDKLDSIKDSSIGHIENSFRDNNGNIWVCKFKSSGEGDGLIEAIPTPTFFNHYLLEYDKTGNTNAYFAVLKDHFGNIWGAARNLNFIFKINPDGKVMKVNSLDEKVWMKAWHPRSFMEDSSGIWIGYYYNLMMFYDFKTGKFKKKRLNENGNEDEALREGFRDLINIGDRLIANCNSRVFVFNTRNKELLSIFKLLSDSLHTSIYTMEKAGDQGYFTGSAFGEVRFYDQQFHNINTWKVGNGLFNVEDICPGDHNDLWLTLLGGGLAHLDLKTGKDEIFTTADGLSNNTCYSILKDRKGNLWISTNHGISRFNPHIRQFRNFGQSDGLKIDEFNSDAAYLAPDGEMFFGGMGGIVSFYPDSLKEQEPATHPSRLVITDFKVSGITRFFGKAVYDMDTVSLSKGDNNFQVTFACLDFQNPEKIRYRYRLSGENENWTETDWRHRFVNYANLAPGGYQLDIEATNLNGDWVSNESLLVRIPPFYYQTLWFRILVVLLTLLLFTYLVYSFIHRIRMKARQQLEELKLESLRGQMNPHFIFNSLNSINYFISQNDRLSANRYIADFSRLIRSILGNLSSDYIPISKELESLNDYLKLEHLRFGDKFDYSVRLPEGMETSDMMVFPGMVQPFVENAIWHGVRGLEGRKGLIRIAFERHDDRTLQCIVEDDGIGRKLAEARKSDLPGKTSKGIGIVLERLRIINNLKKTNYQVKIEDLFSGREESGTRVVIDIPVKYH